MTTLCVPPIEEEPWPTLGPAVVEWMEEHLVFGPGDLIGEPYRLNGEQKALVYRIYEIQPKCECWGTRRCLEVHRSRPGPRRFKRVGISLRKGLMKTELAAAIATAELHAEAPVRCVSWYKRRGAEWVPEGAGVTNPFIPMLATSEEQVERLAFGAMFEMCSRSRTLSRDFDVGLARIMRMGGDGYAEPTSSAPNQNDGARTTHQQLDETHRLYLPNHKAAVQTMRNNIPKRPLADPWTMETTTSYELGQGSVAEDAHALARQIADGKARNPVFFYFHREASEAHDITTRAGLRAAIVEATGEDAMAWSDVASIEAVYDDPTTDKRYWERVWLNRAGSSGTKAFDLAAFKESSRPGERIAAGSFVTLGFDGSRFSDATAIVATEIESGFQQVVGVWENPGTVEGWEVPADEVDGVMREAFTLWDVWRLYADPYYWESELADWSGAFGEKRVVEFRTTRLKLMTEAVSTYARAIAQGTVANDGHEAMVRHIGNARRRATNISDDSGMRLFVIAKERDDSPFKIDAAMAGCLSYQARLDAVASGAKPAKRKKPRVFSYDV